MKLRSLMSTAGVRSAALVGADGLALEAYGEDSEAFAAELASLRATFGRLSRRVGGGAVTRLAVTTEQLEVVAVTAADFILGVSVARGGDTRPAQLELARIASQLALPSQP